MSTVNAVTIFTENLQGANLVVGNTVSNLTIKADSISISVGNVSITPTEIRVGNSTQNTTITPTAITTGSITVNSVSYTKVVSNLVLTDYQVFTNPSAINIWYKPSWAQANDIVTIMMWGGGGGGTNISGIDASAGGGGACVIVNKLAGECDSVCNVVVGDGGRYIANAANATNGRNSVFWTNTTSSITAYGGAGGFANSTLAVGGAGGGWFSAGIINGEGGSPLGGALGNPGGSSTFGGGGGAISPAGGGGSGGLSVYGGGGGGKYNSGSGGNTVYGGGGGGYNGTVGVSMFGGNGGNATIIASAPGGGGGYGNSGARGEVRIWVTGQSR